MCEYKRGDICWANIPKQEGSKNQSGIRPVLIVANDKATKFSPIFQCVPLTTIIKKEYLPVHVILTSGNLYKKTMALVEQTTSLDRYMLTEKIGEVSEHDMFNINKAMLIQLGVDITDMFNMTQMQMREQQYA